MSSYIVSFLNRQPSRRNEGTQIAFRQLGRSRTPNHKESHGNSINLTKRQSPLAKEANIFKENLSEVLLSDSAIKRWREADFSDDSSPGENDYQNVSSPYDRIVTDSSPLRRSPSPRSRSFCQPVFEDDIVVVKDNLLDKTQKASTKMTICTRGNSILSQMLNNPISQAQRKKRNDPSVKNPVPKRNKSRAPREGVWNKSVKDLRAVQTGFAEEKYALMSRDINSSSYSQRLESAISTSKPLTKNRIADYEVGKLIAKGSYSLVRHGMRKKDKVPVAIKTYDHSKLLDVQKRIGVDREINALKQLDHPHIINMMDSFSSKMQTCIVMEEVGTCTLYKYVKSHADNRLTCKETSRIFSQLVDAVRYMHSKNICHRDLKLENIIYESNGNIKLIDFGFSTDSNSKQRTFCGTPTYMAPEITKRKDYYGYKVDNWAMGVILFRLITGTYPFSAKTDRELFGKICQGKIDLSLICDPDAQACVADLLDVNPDSRVTCNEVKVSHSAKKLSFLEQIRHFGSLLNLIKKIANQILK